MSKHRKQWWAGVVAFLLLFLPLPLMVACQSPPPGEVVPEVTSDGGTKKDSTVSDTSPGDTRVADNSGKDDTPKEQTPDDPTATNRPNILLIIADDLGTDSFLDYNDADGDGKADDKRSYAVTPTLSGICKQGIRFKKAWATPYCSSTRSGILTGRYGFRTGIGNAVPRDGGIDPKEWTIPKLLDASKQGHAHANIGKWHLGLTDPLKNLLAPNTMGWSHYVGSPSGSLSDYSNWGRVENGKRGTSTTYATTQTVDDAISWLGKQDKNKPWFLWLAFNAPHTPFHLPPSGLHTQKGLSGTADDIKQNGSSYYRAMVEAMDTEVGRLMTWLKNKGMSENTIVVFIGDNGTPAGAVDPPYNTKRAKGTLFQGGIRVPFCVAGKGVKSGTSDALVHSVDLFATLLELSGVNVSKALPANVKVDSRSFVSVLKDPSSQGQRTWNFSESFEWGKLDDAYRTIRDSRYKYLRDRGPKTPAGQFRVQFFDLQQDPLEKTNLTQGGNTNRLSTEQKAAYDALTKTLDTLLKSR